MCMFTCTVTCLSSFFFFFFFKQKTAYEMRISDWSSDVCSSDLWKFSKEQILELYLNKVYFGGGAYGIDSASRNFFSHPATELSTAEAAIIAGLVKAPSRYSPTADVDAAVARARVEIGRASCRERVCQYG